MGQGYKAPPGDSVAPIVNKLRGQQRQINDLQKPPGTNLSELYNQVQQALANINATVTAAIAANSYTKSQIDALIANPPSGSAVTGNVSATGQVSAGSQVVATTALRGADIYATNAPGFNITGTRVAAWWETATGRGGTASSSIRFKEILEEDALAGEAFARAILSCSIVFYHYKAELAKRDDPSSPDYVGPSHLVHTEVGMIAERLHEAGLWPFVIYERGEDDKLKLDADGQPVPFGIHYEMFSLAVLAAAQWLFARYTDLDARVATLEGKTA